MGTFANIAKGTRARKRIAVRFVGAEETTPIDVRVLSSPEEAEILSAAMKYAKAKGVDKPGHGDPLYDLGIWLHTALTACVDPDSPPEAPAPFFAGVGEIETADNVTGDHLAFIYEQQEQWQTENSPYERSMSHDEMMVRAIRVAGGDQLPFLELRPGLRWSFVRTLALRLVASHAAKSVSGSPSEETTAESPN